MRVVVSGVANATEAEVRTALDEIDSRHDIVAVIQAGNIAGSTVVDRWAAENDVATETYDAAGYADNEWVDRMLEFGDPCLVVAYLGEVEPTCVTGAKARGIPVWMPDR